MRCADLVPDFSGRVALTADSAWGSLFPSAPGVYVVATEPQFPRLFGDTDILYIGQAGREVSRGGTRVQATLRQRWTDYWQGTTPTEREFRDTLRRLIGAGRPILVFFTARPCTPTELLREEATLIERFHHEHRELPPLNRSKPPIRS